MQLLESGATGISPALYEPELTFASADKVLEGAESQYVAGQQDEAAGDLRCIDHYLAAATQTWPRYVAAGPDERAVGLYRSSVQSFIETASAFRAF